MRVLFIADVPPNPDSGASGTEYQTVEAMRASGHEVDAVWANDLSHYVKHGNLHALLEQPISYKKIMLKKLSEKDYDVVHVNQPYGYLAARTLRRLDKKCVFIHRSHGFELRVKRDLAPWIKQYEKDGRTIVRRMLSRVLSPFLDRISFAITRYADGHVVSCTQCRDFLHEEMGVSVERIAVIPQAPPAMFNETPVLQMTAGRSKRMLYVGQFAFVKAPMVLARVINRISEADVEVQFTWVCARIHHTKAASLLSETARRRVTFEDWIPQGRLMKLYDDHGIFLFPSFFEGFGKAFLEAMSRGLCVVAADNGGAHDVIRSGENGVLVSTGDVEAMAKAALCLTRNHAEAERMSRKAAETAREYKWTRVASETVAFYKRRIEAKCHEAVLRCA